ncbi:MAG: ROK family protein [Lachnospiraceae bacterium]|nr:ROK family protein [Lachnospiraceae bacterium]
MYHIGIDLGGTNIAAGVVTHEHKLVCKASVPTALPRSAESLADGIWELAVNMLKENHMEMRQIESLGIGIPGTVNKATGMIEYANNFGFDNVPFIGMLQQRFPCPVLAENDAKAAAWAEYLTGAGASCHSMVAVTLGTGVGGGIILDGKIWDGCNSAAGEIGHMVVERGGRPCTCGRRGCLEAYASATALVQSAREAAGQNPDSMLVTLCGGDLSKLNGKAVFQAAEAKDPTAEAVMDTFIHYLAEGVANLINILQPELLCIGGGLSGAGDLLLLPLREAVRPMIHSKNSKVNTCITLAKLGNDAGIIGAAGLWLL